MMIDRATIEQRLAALRAEQEQAIATVNALAGAIQDCEHWLVVIAHDAAPDVGAAAAKA